MPSDRMSFTKFLSDVLMLYPAVPVVPASLLLAMVFDAPLPLLQPAISMAAQAAARRHLDFIGPFLP